MGTFASFRKCDLQVHSPRDPGWQGARCIGLGGQTPSGAPASEEDVDRDRKRWAEKLVEQCERSGLQCIAITDHHEMVMSRYVEEELLRREEAGNPADLWLFPAMELTLQHGCQAIILFDADLGREWREQAQSSLGISIPAINQYAAAAKQPTPLSFPYTEIGGRLNDIPELKDRYIVLPNVSDGGSNTVLKKSFHQDFRTMPYVGGYLDAGQHLSTNNPTNRRRLSGEDPIWGDRFIYPLPTTDSREAGYPKLGSNQTWVKLSAPKAEALRQAFLAWRSRIHTEPPTFSATVIDSLSISGTRPLADMSMQLSPELNSVIGGRGSGKSTLLEYIAFGIGRSCFDLPEKKFSGKQRLIDLIQETLINHSAEIKTTVRLDGAEFQITRSLNSSYKPRLRYPNGQEEVVSTQELRNLIPGYVYSQGELSELGSSTHATSVSDLLAFVDIRFKGEAEALDKAVGEAKQEQAEALRKLLTLWRSEDEKRRIENRVSATRARIKALQSTLPKLDPVDQQVIDAHNKFLITMEQVEQAVEDITHVEDLLESLTEGIDGIQKIDAIDAPEASVLIKAIEQTSEPFVRQAKALKKSFSKQAEVVRVAGAEWQSFVELHKKKRDAIVAKMSKHKATAGQVAELQKQATAEAARIIPLEKKIKSLGDPSAEVRAAQASLKKKVAAQSARYAQWGNIIEDLSNGIVTVRIEEMGDLDEIHSALEIAAARTRSQEGVRIRRFAELSEDQDAWQAMATIRSECLALMRWKIVDDNDQTRLPPLTAVIRTLGDGDALRRSFIDQMDETRLMAVAEAVPKARVYLDYKSGSASVPFEKASEGQRAAVLLMMLLKQGGGPLLVDQPEGDLDNAVITAVVDLLHDVKSKRQLIFATHNANLVVNGASEFVAAMCNDESGVRCRECEGSIDQPDVRQAITDTMEGGREAFRDRQRKYGF